MKIALANDTSGTSNPGCQGTVAMLRNLIESKADILSRIPVNYHYSPPPPPPSPTPNLLRRGFNKLTRTIISPPPPDPDQAEKEWHAMLPDLTKRLEPLWKEVELLVINAEGTIHHQAEGAKILIALCAAARSMGKRTALVNGSIFELDRWLLNALKENADIISVREPVSYDYLTKNGIDAHQSADCLFLSHHTSHPKITLPKTPYAVYTPGVLSGSGAVPEETIAEDIRLISAAGLKVYYYVIEIEDEPLARIAANAGAEIIPLGYFSWQQVTPFLSGADLVVSGRYHINIYAALSGTPFIPMETNTSKMNGLLKLLNTSGTSLVRAWKNSTGAPDPLHLDTAIHVSPETIHHCVALAEKSRTHLFSSAKQ